MYYLLDKKYDESYTINFLGVEQFNVGDTLKIIMPECVNGINTITSYTDTVSGETDNVYLKKTFRYKNGIDSDWSEYFDIEEITNVTICPLKCLQIELLYFRLDDGGANNDIKITLSNVSIGGEYDITTSDSDIVLSTVDSLQILEIGDILKIFSIDDFQIIASTTNYDLFTTKYRFSQNERLTWTEWEYLTKENISTVKWDTMRFVDMQVMFELNEGVNINIKIYDLILYGDFQNVTANSKKINLFGLKENCVNLAFKTSEITEQTGGIDESLTTDGKTLDSTTTKMVEEASEYQLKMNFITQGLNCYSNNTNSNSKTQIDKLNEENEASDSGMWNPYEFTKITEFYDMLAQQVSQILSVPVDYHLTDPDGGGIDKILNEYQLYNVVAYDTVSVIVPGNQFPENQIVINQFNLDLFDSFKVNILKNDFKKVFGVHRRPGQEDILYFCQVNRLYRVKHSQIHKNVMNTGIYYDLVLEKYEEKSNIRNRVTESKTKIEELTRNSTIDTLFGFDQENEYKKIANKTQLKPKSFDFIRSVINPRTYIKKEDIYNGDIKLIESYYDFSNVAVDEVAVQYTKADQKLLKSDNRSFIVWFNIPNKYSSDNYISKDMINSYDVSDDKFNFINNMSGEQGYNIWLQEDVIYLMLNDVIHKMDVDVMTNVWFGLIVNIDQRQRSVSMKLVRRNSQVDVILYHPTTYEKLELDLVEDISDIEYEMNANGFRAVDNIETTSIQSSPSFITMNEYSNTNTEPIEFEHDLDLSINGSKMFVSNIRVLDDLIRPEHEQIILNELIIKESQHLILGDNANKKLLTTNYKNKQWR